MNIFELMEDIGSNIRYEMNRCGLNQTQLSKKAGVARQTISSYVKGERLPSIPNLINIAYALECEIEDLIVMDGDPIE